MKMNNKLKCWVEINPFWGIVKVQEEHAQHRLYGWIVSTEDIIENSCLVCNGVMASEMKTSFSSGPQKERFSYMPENVVGVDFNCTIPSVEGDLEIHFCSKTNGKPYNEYASYFWGSWLEGYVLPSRELIELVAGGYYPYLFNLNGYSTYKNIIKILNNVVGKPLGDYEALFDWGCGCGRTSRFFGREEKCPAVLGADIVPELVEYCQKQYSFGEFSQVNTVPPTPYAGSSFDLVIALSVLTHIKEDEHLMWLSELERITKAGAILLLSIHNYNSLAYMGFTRKPVLMDNFNKYGFADAGQCDNLDGFIKEKDYYHNVFHSEEYIEKIWSKYFDVVEVVVGANARHQDIVVLKKR